MPAIWGWASVSLIHRAPDAKGRAVIRPVDSARRLGGGSVLRLIPDWRLSHPAGTSACDSDIESDECAFKLAGHNGDRAIANPLASHGSRTTGRRCVGIGGRHL